jgi:choline dehydrogenase-like flavoprotein
MERNQFQAIVVGSGFAGAVTACRLAQAGVEICLLERGRRYGVNDFPAYPFASQRQRREEGNGAPGDYEPPRDFSRWLWRVDQGLWDIRDLGAIKAAQAAGYGGGSLVYANVHLRAPREVFEPQPGDAARAAPWPSVYRRTADHKGVTPLDDYYNLAAFMLDVQPFPQEKYRLAKTRRLQEAAGEGKSGSKRWFHPPLAVNFSGQPRTARLNRQRQSQCDLRGFCSIGCGIHAKNTLDLNYLAVAEDPTLSLATDRPDGDPEHAPKPAHVVTLAEVVGIERSQSTSDEYPFTVTYNDLLRKRETKVSAKWVFLCAGALNTTQLLSANAKLLHQYARKQLGCGYYPNGDALAVVFDCDKPHEVDRGPTITTSLLYKVDGNWLLVQDGGVPEELDLVLGVFRSPLWLRRNRFREHKREEDQHIFRGYRHLRPTGARELLAALPPHGAERVQGTVGPELPVWLKKAFKAGGRRLLQRISVAAEPVAQQALDQLALYLQQRLDELAVVLPNGKELLKGATDLGLARGLLRLGAQLLWGSESDAIRRAVETLLRAAPRNLDETTRAFVSVLRWCADYKPGDGRTGVLLTMGRDQDPLKLDYVEGVEDEPLRIHERQPADAEDEGVAADTKIQRSVQPLRTTQERVFRDIAKFWKGELRTNPTWTFARSHVTVHSQGGCRMSVSAKDGVTDADGEVFGCEGLYVMDAAAFPSPVGVNPSATIAAVAERKIERFIQKQLGRSHWHAPEWDEAQRWAETPEVAAMLDPLATVKATEKAQAEIIGLEFKELMRGHYSDGQEGPEWASKLREDVTREGAGLSRATLDDWLERYAKAEIRGIRKASRGSAAAEPESGEIAVVLNAKIEDLTAFLDYESSRKPQESGMAVTLSGFVLFGKDARRKDLENAPADARCPINSGTLQLFRAAKPVERRKALEYKMEFVYGRKTYRLHGLKVIEDDPRLDVWRDASTLNFDIEDVAAQTKKWRGVLRLPAAEFLRSQVQSFQVTGTTDEDRKIWALGAFVAFFVGHLAGSYLPELKKVPPLLQNMLLRTHG